MNARFRAAYEAAWQEVRVGTAENVDRNKEARRAFDIAFAAGQQFEREQASREKDNG